MPPKKKPPAGQEASKHLGEHVNIENWVFHFLGTLAAAQESNKSESREKSLPPDPSRIGTKSNHLRRFRSPTPYAWNTDTARTPLDAMRHPTGSDVSCAGDDFLEDAANNPPGSVPMTDALKVPRISESGCSDDRQLLQKINQYIKAGIVEGQRRAKHYVRRALTFGVETGYLVPVDHDGKLLRISATLGPNEPKTETNEVEDARKAGKGRHRKRRQANKRRSKTRGRNRQTKSKGRSNYRKSVKRKADEAVSSDNDEDSDTKVKTEGSQETKVPDTGAKQVTKRRKCNPTNQKDDDDDNLSRENDLSRDKLVHTYF